MTQVVNPGITFSVDHSLAILAQEGDGADNGMMVVTVLDIHSQRSRDASTTSFLCQNDVATSF